MFLFNLLVLNALLALNIRWLKQKISPEIICFSEMHLYIKIVTEGRVSKQTYTRSLRKRIYSRPRSGQQNEIFVKEKSSKSL